jgi:hypothetical protein
MEWYHYVYCFLSGMFLANSVPHFVCGVCGNKFPSPFSKPPGIGPTSPPVNVIWALVNLVAGYLLFRAGHVNSDNWITLVVFLAGITLISLQLSIHFQKKKVD